jgi:hypothetical protein
VTKHGQRVPVLILMVLVWSLSGCKPQSREFEQKIVTRIKQCHDPNDCQVSVEGLTEFQWDRAYVFAASDSRKSREVVLGCSDVGYQEMTRQIVFMKNGKLVHQESEPSELEGAVSDEVDFKVTTTYPNFAAFGPSAVFSVLKRVDPRVGVHFELMPIE